MLELLKVEQVWQRGDHNAFTDLCRFDGFFWLVFREAADHISDDGRIIVLRSRCGFDWQLMAELAMVNADLRDPKIIATVDKRLMITLGAVVINGVDGVDGVDAEQKTLRSFLYFSDNGQQWSAAQPVADEHEWLWRSRYIDDDCYAVSYKPGQQSTRLFKLDSADQYQVCCDPLFSKEQNNLGYPNEHDLFQTQANDMHCLLRRDADTLTAQLGFSESPFTQWQWRDLGVQIGGPVVCILASGKVLAALRLYEPARTSLCYLDCERAELEEVLVLPSGGDTSYAGLVEHQGFIYCSYYSSHEGKTAIYMAKLGQ
ncbi:MAG: hypothetical protein ACJAYG_000680 [Oceanicoccus sp.]